jgi:predicted DNA-binding ribbon-helix-helix protein
MIRKRSVTLDGHRTSVSLEDEYWKELKRMAAGSAVPLAVLIERIDRERGTRNLSSALRLSVLLDLKKRSGPAL